MNTIEPAVIARVVGNVISGTALTLLVGWGVSSIYMVVNKNKCKNLLKSKQKTK